jgi:hypothetical protein
MIRMGKARTRGHLLHAQSRVVTVELMHGISVFVHNLGVFHNLIGDLHVRQRLQNLNLLLDHSFVINQGRAMAAEDVRDSGVVLIGQVLYRCRIGDIRCSRRISNELGQILENAEAIVQGPLAQLSEWKFLSIIVQLGQCLFEVLFVEDHFHESLNRLLQGAFNRLGTGIALLRASSASSTR